jgi:LysM repeat protein
VSSTTPDTGDPIEVTAASSDTQDGTGTANVGNTAAATKETAVPAVEDATEETATLSEPAVHVVQAGDSLAAIAQAYGVSVSSIVQANGILDPDRIDVGQTLIIADPVQVPAASSAAPAAAAEDNTATVAASLPTHTPALVQLPDEDPGPPLTVEVSANRATQDPLVEASRTYQVTGIVRNDGDETYAVSALYVTFYDAEGFRGTFTPAIRDGKVVGGEWHWHGETEAELAALLLAPGEVWPFNVEIVAQDMASFVIHPDAAPTGRESAPLELTDVTLVDDGTGYLRISGTASNENLFAVQNVTVSGVLLDASGQIVSVGSVYVLQEDIEPGTSVDFEVRIARDTYSSYQLYAQAERDWQ